MGGVEFATPDAPGKLVKSGKRFELAAKGDEDWQAWRPRLHYGAVMQPGSDAPLTPLRLSQIWSERLFGFRQQQARHGWILPLSDGSLLGPRNLFAIPRKPMTARSAGKWLEANFDPINSHCDATDPNPAAPSGKATGQLLWTQCRIHGLSLDQASLWPVERLAHTIDREQPPERLWITSDLPAVGFQSNRINSHRTSTLVHRSQRRDHR